MTIDPHPSIQDDKVCPARVGSRGALGRIVGVAAASWLADVVGGSLGTDGVFSSIVSPLQTFVGVAILSILSALPLSIIFAVLVNAAYQTGLPIRRIAITGGAVKFVGYSAYFLVLVQPSPTALLYVGTFAVAAATTAGIWYVLGPGPRKGRLMGL